MSCGHQHVFSHIHHLAGPSGSLGDSRSGGQEKIGACLPFIYNVDALGGTSSPGNIISLLFAPGNLKILPKSSRWAEVKPS